MNNTLNLKQYIIDSINDLHFKSFTEIQKKVMPLALKGRDIIGKSVTGSGKTHAFLIPIFQKLEENKKEVQVVITTPTRELAIQIENVCKHIASFCDETIDIRTYVGGSDREREKDRLRSSQPQIVIGTPGKIKDLSIDENLLKIYTARTLVIDEADMTLEAGFIDDIDTFAGTLPNKLQMMVFSATIPEQLIVFTKKYMFNPEYIEVKNKGVSSVNIEHILVAVKNKNKLQLLDDLLSVINPYLCLVFANKKENVEMLQKELTSKGYKVGVMHGDLEPRERKRMLKRIMDLEFQYVVASDIAARGIDIEGVSHVINYELPKDFEFYIHRTGRTGRANLSGTAISLYDFISDEYLDALEEKGIKFEYKKIVDGELVETKERNQRTKRVQKVSEIDIKAKQSVRKPKKVKPGYKKKMEEAVRVERRKLKLEEFRRERKKGFKK